MSKWEPLWILVWRTHQGSCLGEKNLSVHLIDVVTSRQLYFSKIQIAISIILNQEILIYCTFFPKSFYLHSLIVCFCVSKHGLNLKEIFGFSDWRNVEQSGNARGLPSQERPCDVTPDKLSLQTLQKVGRAWEQAYQLCIPEKCSTLNCAVWERRGENRPHETLTGSKATTGFLSSQLLKWQTLTFSKSRHVLTEG